MSIKTLICTLRHAVRMLGFEDRPQRIISDFGKLDFDYVPDKLVHRDAPLQRMFSIMRSTVEEGLNQRLAITGSVGTGKSCLSKRFCMDFQAWASGKGRRVEYVVVNCRSRNTPSGVMLKILEPFQPNFPDRGFSISEMLEILRKDLVKTSAHLVIVLDEVNVLVKKAGPDLLYSLSRFDDEKISGTKHTLSLILVSQQPVNEYLDPATLSTLKRTNMIALDKYNHEELADIVRQRVELAFFPGTVDEEIIDFIAEVSAQLGDARFAIEILENAGRMAGEEGAETVEAEHVRAAKAMSYSVITESKLRALDEQKSYVLLAIARIMRRRAFVTTGEAEKSYAVVCEEYGVKPRGHTQFWEYLQALSDMGMITIRISGKGQVGKTSNISLPDIPSRVLEDKLLQIIGNTGEK